MIKLFKTSSMKRLTKKFKTKRGATLIEMIATVAILSIVASLSFEAMFMAGEEYRRVARVADCERSISLMQENLNLYVKNAVDIKFYDNSADPSATFESTINNYFSTRTDLQDAVNQTDHQYIDLILYRSGPFHYTLAKYTLITGHNPEWEPILKVNNIKEINFSMKELTSSFHDGAKQSYLFDYAIMAPTGFEMDYAKDDEVDQAVDSSGYSNKEGIYSVMTGTVINNMETWTGSTNQLRICENVTASGLEYKGDCNFVVIRTVPREAK